MMYYLLCTVPSSVRQIMPRPPLSHQLALGVSSVAISEVYVRFLTINVPFSIRVAVVSHAGRTSSSAFCSPPRESSIPCALFKGAVKSRIFRCWGAVALDTNISPHASIMISELTGGNRQASSIVVSKHGTIKQGILLWTCSEDCVCVIHNLLARTCRGHSIALKVVDSWKSILPLELIFMYMAYPLSLLSRFHLYYLRSDSTGI